MAIGAGTRESLQSSGFVVLDHDQTCISAALGTIAVSQHNERDILTPSTLEIPSWSKGGIGNSWQRGERYSMS